MDSHYIITDGGVHSMPRVHPSLGPSPLKPIKVLSIRDGHLRVVNEHFKDGSVGVIHSNGSGSKLHSCVPFLVVPREDALETTRLGDVSFHPYIIQSAKSLLRIQKKVGGKAIERGVHRLSLTDNEDGVLNYLTMGCRLRRSSSGVDQHTFHARHDCVSYNRIVKLGSRINHLMYKYTDTDYINTIEEALAQVGHPVLRPTEGNKHVCKAFTNAAIGDKLYHNEHVDDDFGPSAVVFLSDMDDCCILHDNQTVRYFTFPTLGLAVALRVGDVLIWNPQVPHASSSIACNRLGKLYGISFYNKTRVVGGNDNLRQLNGKQFMFAKEFESSNN